MSPGPTDHDNLDPYEEDDEEAASAFFADLEGEHQDRVLDLNKRIEILEGTIRERDLELAVLAGRIDREQKGFRKTIGQLVAWSLLRHQAMALLRAMVSSGDENAALVLDALNNLDEGNALLIRKADNCAPDGTCPLCGLPLDKTTAIAAGVGVDSERNLVHSSCLVKSQVDEAITLVEGLIRGADEASHDDDKAAQFTFVAKHSLLVMLDHLTAASDNCTPTT